jgi:hypothetical protein
VSKPATGKKAPRITDVPPPTTLVATTIRAKAPPAPTAAPPKVDRPAAVAAADTRTTKPRRDAAPAPATLEAAALAVPEPIRKTARRDATPAPASAPAVPAVAAAAPAPTPKKPPRVAKAAAVAARPAPVAAPVIHRRPRPAGGDPEPGPRRRGTLAEDALAESGATRTFRSAIEHVIDDLADQRDRTKK